MKPAWFVGTGTVVALLWWRRRRLAPAVLVGGLLVAVGTAVYGTGAVHLPDLDRVLERVGTTLGAWTYLLVAVMAFAETGAFLGFVAPGETVVLVGGMVAGQGKIDLAALIAVVWSCAVIGDLVSFELGRRHGRELLLKHGKHFHITPERISQVESYFGKRGGQSILIGRFIGFVRPLAPFLAGSSAMPLRQFLAYDVIAAGIWSLAFSVLGFVFWQSLDQVLAVAKQGSLILGAVFVVGAGGYAAIKWARDAENRPRIEAAWQRVLAYPVAGPVLRLGAVVARWARRPAGFVLDRITPGNLGLELTAMASIVAVGGFVFVGYLATVWDGSITLGDRRAQDWSGHLTTGWLTHLAEVVTTFGRFDLVLVAVALTALVLIARRRGPEAVALVTGLWATGAITQLVKVEVARPRPTDALVVTTGWSFPSGHTSNSVAWLAIGVAVWQALPGWRSRASIIVAGATLTAAIGLTRVYLRAHWWSDVAAGWGLGLAVYGLCAVAALVVDHRRKPAATLLR